MIEDCGTPEDLATFGELVDPASEGVDTIAMASFGYLCDLNIIIPELIPFVPQIKYRDDSYFLMINNLLPRGYIWESSLDIIDQIINNFVPGEPPPALPNNPPFVKIETTNIFKRLLSCFASELARVELQTMELVKESVPGLATEEGLLTRWEKNLGLPDECSLELINSLNVLDRQRQAQAKFVGENETTTAQYFIDYAAILGWEITVQELIVTATAFRAGKGRAGNARAGGQNGFANIQITIVLGSTDTSLLKCIFRRIKPAHIIFNYIE